MAKGSAFKNVVGKASGYAKPASVDAADAAKWLQGGNAADIGLSGRAMQMGQWGRANLQNAAQAEGRSVLGMSARHAVQGAAWGAVAGGAIEATQGGSFWDGAKQGAFNGAAISAGARGLKRAVGGEKGAMNYVRGQQSVGASATNMWRATAGDPQISGQARAILNQRQMEGVTRMVMNQRKSQG